MKRESWKRRESAPDEYRTWLPPEYTLGAGAPEREILTPLPKEELKLPNPDVRRDEFNFEQENRNGEPSGDTYEIAKAKKKHKRMRRAFYSACAALFVSLGLLSNDSALFGYLNPDSDIVWDEPDEPEMPVNSGLLPTLPAEEDMGPEDDTEAATAATEASPQRKFIYHPNYGRYDAVGMRSVYDGAIDFEGEYFGERRLSFMPYDDGGFSGESLPEASQQEGFVNIGYILICDRDSYGGRPTSTWMLQGNYLSRDDVNHVKFSQRDDIEIRMVRYDPNHQNMQMVLGMHANGGNFDADEYPLFSIDSPEYCEFWTCTPLYSEGYTYLDAYPVPKRDGYTFTGWYSSEKAAALDPFDEAAEKARICVLEAFDFFEKDPSGGDSEGVDWNSPVTYHVYAGWQKD